MVDNQLRFTRESRRDWEKLGGGASCAGKDGVRAARAGMGAMGVVGAVGTVGVVGTVE